MTTIVTRAGKGTPLTWNEVDANFTNLNTDKVEVSTLSAQSGATLVGLIQSGTGAISRTTQDKLREIKSNSDYSTNAYAQSAAILAKTGGFWADQTPSPNIRRLPDRLFIGNGVSSSGQESPATTESWVYQSFGAHWLERGAQLFTLPEGAGYIGAFSASRASTVDPVGNVAIGMAALAWNDFTGTRLSWAGYFEVVRESGAGVTYGIEVSGKNKGSNHLRNPYAKDSGGILGAFFAGGGDASYAGSPANPNNVAVVIGKNSHTWNTGICFDADSITGTNGVTGTGSAIKMARGHKVTWFCDATNIGAEIYSMVSSGANKTKTLYFDDSSAYIGVSGAPTLFNFDMVAGSVNGFQLTATASATGYVALTAQGADTNLDIYMNPKGTGKVRLGSYTGGAPSATGYITVKDLGGNTYKLLCGI